jgi:hypothetical protein
MPALSFPSILRSFSPARSHSVLLLLPCLALAALPLQAQEEATEAGEAAVAELPSESVESVAAEDGPLVETPATEMMGVDADGGAMAPEIVGEGEAMADALLGDGEMPAPAESAEEAAVDQAEDQAISAPVNDVPGELTEPTEGDVPGELQETTEATEGGLPEGEFLGEDIDLIPLPEGVDADGMFLDLPMDDGTDLLLPADIPPLDIAPALPPVPVGEPAKIISARYKQLRIKVEKDPAVVSLWEQAQAASTYEQQRAGLREYYRLLFAKMREEDPTLTMRIDAMEQAYIQRLSQTRIEPTIPLQPPPTPEPLAPLP